VIRKAVALSMLLSSLAGPCSQALAAPDNDAPIVRVFVAGPAEALLRTRAVLHELLARIHVDAVVESADGEAVLTAAGPDTAPRAFLDFRSPAAPRVVLVQSASGKELERRTLAGSTSLEVSVEEAAHVLYMALESSLRAHDDNRTGRNDAEAAAAGTGAASSPAAAATSAVAATAQPDASKATKPVDVGPPPLVVARDEPAPPHDAGTHPGRPSLELETGLSVFGALSSYDAEHPLPGIGGAFDVALGAARLRPAAMLSLGAFFPSSVSDTGASLRAETARLDLMAEWHPWPRVRAALGVGGGAERVTFVAGSSTTSLLSSGTQSRVDPMLGAVLAIRFRVVGALEVLALGALDVDLTPHRYVTQSGADVMSTVFALPRTRPTACLGLTYVFHDPARATSVSTAGAL
jgi:hypothetical protein